MRYLFAGEGPPLVLLHGAGDDARAWSWVLPDLARKSRVYVPNFPGFGGDPSDGRRPEDYSSARLARFIAGFLDAVGERSAALMGNSPVFVKVIGAGFGRTGTLSLKVALERLGFGPCYHMTELFGKPDHITFWDEAADAVELGEPVAWERVFSGYEATVDWPGCVFYGELVEAYPEAKVILTTRDPERWYDSAEKTIARMPKLEEMPPAQRLFVEVGRFMDPGMRRGASMAEKIIDKKTFGGRFDERKHAVKTFERHVEEVEKHVPPEKLLVYEVREGWRPLCEFLGVEEPDEPFPRLNERDDFPKVMAMGVARAFVPTAAKAAAVTAILLAFAWLSKSPGKRLRERWTTE